MNQMRILFLWLVVMLCASSCLRLMDEPSFKLLKVNEEVVDSELFKDEMIEITFLSQDKCYNISVKNKSAVPLKIVWDECTFNEEAHSGGIINKDVNLYQESYNIEPTTILPGNIVFDKIIPIRRIYFEDNIAYISDLKVDSLYGHRLQLEFEKGGEKLNYKFDFEYWYGSEIHLEDDEKAFIINPWYVLSGMVVSFVFWRIILSY